MAACLKSSTNINLDSGGKKLVLAGNPNVGKSVFFNYLTGLYVDVANYPGTTLDIYTGRYEEWVVYDTPGIYGFSSFNQAEKLVCDLILEADLVLNIVNAVTLDRDLFLTRQIIDTGVPVVVALNMGDEAVRRGLRIDTAVLSRELGVPVVPTLAVEGKGLKETAAALVRGVPGHPDPAITEQLALWRRQKQFTGTPGAALAAMEADEIQREKAYYSRRQQVNRVYRAVVTETPVGATIGAKLGYWLLHPATGLPVLAGVLGLMYWLLGVFVAGDIVDLTKDGLMQGYYEPFIRNLLAPVIAPDSVAGRLFFGEYGVLTMPFTLLIGLLLPLVLAFYFFLAMLEDVGYLPRMAVLTDRLLKQIGLSGLVVIPFILGFGCVTLATITTRLLPSERERRIAIFLLGLVIPCSAQLGVLTGLLAVLDPALIGLFVVVMLTIFIGVGTIMDRILPGRPAELVLELPPLQWPRLKNILRKTAVKSRDFLNEAFPLFVGGALVLGGLQVTGLLTRLEVLASPLTGGWLHLPPETARIFIMGLVRRDLGAAALVDMPLAPEQAVVALITLTLFVPCFAAAMMIFKERPKREGVVMWLLIWAIAFFTGGVVAQLLATFQSILWTAGLFVLFLILLAGSAAIFAKLREREPVRPLLKG